MSKIKNIIFDIGGVLVDFVPADAFRKTGAKEEDIKRLLDATVDSNLWNELDKGIIPESEIIAQMVAGCEDKEDEIRRFFDEGKEYVVEEFDYACNWLKSVKDEGFNVYLLSNYPESYFDLHERNKFQFIKHIDGKVVSAYEKCVKPDRKIYEILLERYNLVAEECIFIDDRIVNVEAAREIGIEAIQFTSYDDVCQKLRRILQ